MKHDTFATDVLEKTGSQQEISPMVPKAQANAVWKPSMRKNMGFAKYLVDRAVTSLPRE